MRDAINVTTDLSPDDTGPTAHRTALLQLRRELERLWSRHSALNAALDEKLAIDSVGRLLLGVLASTEPIRSSDLAEILGLSRPAVSRRVADLEDQGLVDSVKDPDDGRACLLRLSQQGTAHLQRTIDSGVQVVDRLTDGFTLTDVQTLAELLLRLNDNANRLRPASKRATTGER